MFLIDTVILVASLLVLVGIASSKLSSRFGVPVLVLFLGVGMLAGEDGIGRIEFNDYVSAHAIGTLALAIILFDGGLQTSFASVRKAWKASFILATFGVLVTAIITGVAASLILNLSWLEGMLLGSIVGSTDAAAVFLALRNSGMTLSDRLSSTLEIESGSNDPMAIFLTIGCIELLLGKVEFGPQLIGLFLTQMMIGALVGLALGALAVWIINRINLSAAGLYPVLATTFGLFAFGLAAALGGSGFLAAYLSGIVIGNTRLVFQRGIFLYVDALAWLSQIAMFVVLGLLVSPSSLPAISLQGLLIGVVLVVVARPVAVILSLLPLRFSLAELTLLSWGGLKGAVPITLATFPLLFNIPNSHLLFNVVFFIVVLSALVQGWTLPLAARRLGLQLPPRPASPVTLQLSSLQHVDGDIVEYAVGPHSRAAGRRVRELALPEGVVVALVARNQQIIPPHGHTRIERGDYVIVVLRPETRPLADRIFAEEPPQQEDLPALFEFPLRASIRVRELEEFYGVSMHAPTDCTLDEAVRQQIPAPKPGEAAHFGPIHLYVRELNEDGTVDQVGMVISTADNTLPTT